jgi:hypothetical protein
LTVWVPSLSPWRLAFRIFPRKSGEGGRARNSRSKGII